MFNFFFFRGGLENMVSHGVLERYIGCCNHGDRLGPSGGVMVSKLDLQIFRSEFGSHWVPHPYGLVAHLSKTKLSKLRPWCHVLTPHETLCFQHPPPQKNLVWFGFLGFMANQPL